MDFLRGWFDRNNESYFGSWFYFPPLDVMQIAAFQLLGKRHLMPNFQLTSVYEEIIGEPMIDAHDALVDIKATRILLNKILENQKKF